MQLLNLPTDPGDTVTQVDQGTVVIARSARGTGGLGGQRLGLKLCKCIKTEWQCQIWETGEIYCFEVCMAWDCKDVPTPT
jgi:hypothetical protein